LLGVSGPIAPPDACAQSIIPARPEAIGGGNPIEGLGRPDDPNPSREADYSSRFDPYASESSESPEESEDGLGRNENPQAKSDSVETRNEFADTRYESEEGRSEPAEAKRESAEAKRESSEAKGQSSEARNEYNEARRESAESKRESAEGRREANDAFNEGAESRSDSAAELESGGLIKRRTGSLAPTLPSPQPGETIRRGGFANFSKEQEASIKLDLELRAAKEARQRAAQKQAAAKTDTNKSDNSKSDKGDGTAKSDASKSGKAGGDEVIRTGAKVDKSSITSKAGRGDKVGKSPAPGKAEKSGGINKPAASRKLSQADHPAKNSVGSHSTRQGLVPPPPPYSVPLVSKSENTPERKALELINKKKYAIAESKLQDLISESPDNCHARYLLGVSLVMQRKYDEARNEYSYVIEHSTDEKLIDLATQGLQKL